MAKELSPKTQVMLELEPVKYPGRLTKAFYEKYFDKGEYHLFFTLQDNFPMEVRIKPGNISPLMLGWRVVNYSIKNTDLAEDVLDREGWLKN